ncbi:MAG: hypothetical protein RIC55_22750 [Pirellulaceae bacterium]
MLQHKQKTWAIHVIPAIVASAVLMAAVFAGCFSSPSTPSSSELPYDKDADADQLWALVQKYHREQQLEERLLTLDRLLELDPSHAEAISLRAVIQHVRYLDEKSPEKKYQGLHASCNILLDGLKHNPDDEDLLTSLEMYLGRSIDEDGLRDYFARDAELQSRLERWTRGRDVHDPREKVNNWLVVREIRRARAARIGTGPVSDHREFEALCGVAHASRDYAASLAKDGHSDDHVLQAWREAEREFEAFEQQEFRIESQSVDGVLSRLEMSGVGTEGLQPLLEEHIGRTLRPSDLARLKRENEQRWERLEEFHPGLRSLLRDSIRQRLRTPYRQALSTPPEQRTFLERQMAEAAKLRLSLLAEDLAAAFRGKRTTKEIENIIQNMRTAEREMAVVDALRNVVNMDAAKDRCTVEQRPEILAARRRIYKAQRLMDQGDLNRQDRQAVAALFDEAFTTYERATRDNTKLLAEYAGEFRREFLQFREEIQAGEPPAHSSIGLFYQALYPN